jgi:hypothetical protein
MHCPYCMEGIKDGVTLCRFCNRDLTYYAVSQAMPEKVSALEDKLSEMDSRLGNVTEHSQSRERSIPSSFIGTLFIATRTALDTAVEVAISRGTERELIVKRMAAAVSTVCPSYS